MVVADFHILAAVLMFVWIVGVLGNIANILVFSRTERQRLSINVIFWWLSVGNLVELFVYAVCMLTCTKDCITLVAVEQVKIITKTSEDLLLLNSFYILMVFRIIQIALNVILAILRYLDVQKQSHQNGNHHYRNSDSIQQTVIIVYIFSLVVCVPILDIPSFMNFEIKKISFYKISKLIWFCVYCIMYMVTIVGSLVMVIVSASMLIFELVKLRVMADSVPIVRQERSVKQNNILISIMIFVFFMISIPSTARIATTSMFGFWKLFSGTKRANKITAKSPAEFMINYKDSFHQTMALILIKCSYPVFCYLLFSTPYRRVFNLLLVNMYRTILNTFRKENPEADMELESL